jgi:hypothetical protein
LNKREEKNYIYNEKNLFFICFVYFFRLYTDYLEIKIGENPNFILGNNISLNGGVLKGDGCTVGW